MIDKIIWPDWLPEGVGIGTAALALLAGLKVRGTLMLGTDPAKVDWSDAILYPDTRIVFVYDPSRAPVPLEAKQKRRCPESGITYTVVGQSVKYPTMWWVENQDGFARRISASTLLTWPVVEK